MEHALTTGYRLIDGAYCYGNEDEVGQGIRAAISKGAVKREDIFVVSKVWATYNTRVELGLDKSLKSLGLDYVDLFLVHWPLLMNPDGNDDRFPKLPNGDRDIIRSYNHVDTWKQMEAVLETGKTRSVGVSNVCASSSCLLLFPLCLVLSSSALFPSFPLSLFPSSPLSSFLCPRSSRRRPSFPLSSHPRPSSLFPSFPLTHTNLAQYSKRYLEQLLPQATVVPAVNQIENHPGLPQQEIVDLCREHGIHIMAYSPFGSTGGPLFTAEPIVQTAAKHGVSPASILLSYHVARGSTVLAKSVTPARIDANKTLVELDVTDLALLNAYSDGLAKAGKLQRFVYPPFGVDFGFPDKS